MRTLALASSVALAGCFEPSVLTAPTRQPSMPIVDREQAPQPVMATPTGGPIFKRDGNETAGQSTSLSEPARALRPVPFDAR